MSTSFEAELSRVLAEHAGEVAPAPGAGERVLRRATQLRRRRGVAAVSFSALTVCSAVLVTATVLRAPAGDGVATPSTSAAAAASASACVGGTRIVDVERTIREFQAAHPQPAAARHPGWTVGADGNRTVVEHDGVRTLLPVRSVIDDISITATPSGLLVAEISAVDSAVSLVTASGTLHVLTQSASALSVAPSPDGAQVAYRADAVVPGAAASAAPPAPAAGVHVLDLATRRETALLPDGPGAGATRVAAWGERGIVIQQPGGFLTWRPGTTAVEHRAQLLAVAQDSNAVLVQVGQCAYDEDPAHVGSPVADRAVARNSVEGNPSVTSLSFVRTTAAEIYAAYFTADQRYLSGSYADPADEILVVTATGSFPHSVPYAQGTTPAPQPTSETALWTVNLSRAQTADGVTISPGPSWDLGRLGRPTTLTGDQLR